MITFQTIEDAYERFDEENTYLWRYFDLHKLISFLSSGSLFFSRMDKFEDLNEGISRNQLYDHYKEEQRKEGGELPLEIRQKRLFASCWFYGKRESVAMWNLYASGDGVAIRIKAKSLLDEFRNERISVDSPDQIGRAYLGPVFYKDFLDPADIAAFKEETRVIGFQKDKSFEHENEFRFLIRQRYDQPDDAFLDFISVKIDEFDELPFQLLFHPKMLAWQKANVGELLTRLGSNMEMKDSELRLQ